MLLFFFFFFNDTATTEIYTLSLHDALPIYMYAFHITVPAGASAVDATFDFISPPDIGGFWSGSSVTSELAVLSWNQFLLAPEGVPSDLVRYQASLKVPRGWRYGTALPIEHESGEEIEFKPSSLTTLIDSPVSAGAHYRTIELGRDGAIAHYLHVAADSDRALEITPAELDHLKNLVREAVALFRSRPFRRYPFLLTLNAHLAHFCPGPSATQCDLPRESPPHRHS